MTAMNVTPAMLRSAAEKSIRIALELASSRRAGDPLEARLARTRPVSDELRQMIGFGIGGVLMGKLSDRLGVVVPVVLGALGLGAGFIAAGTAPTIWQFGLATCWLIGLLCASGTFAPSRANVTAAALPLPQPGPIEPAPTTMAIFPLSRSIVSLPVSLYSNRQLKHVA